MRNKKMYNMTKVEELTKNLQQGDKIDFNFILSGIKSIYENFDFSMINDELIESLFNSFMVNKNIFEKEFVYLGEKKTLGEIVLFVFDFLDLRMNKIKELKQILIDSCSIHVDKYDEFVHCIKNISLEKFEKYIIENHKNGYIFKIEKILNGEKLKYIDSLKITQIKTVLAEKIEKILRTEHTKKQLNEINSMKFVSVLRKGGNWYLVKFVDFENGIYQDIDEIEIIEENNKNNEYDEEPETVGLEEYKFKECT
jgi:hypothetical protein